MQANRQIYLVSSCAILCLGLSSCPTRPEIRAHFWMHNGIPYELCDKEPRLKDSGFYRRLNDGRFEFISFCDERALRWLAIYNEDLEKLINTFPEQRNKR